MKTFSISGGQLTVVDEDIYTLYGDLAWTAQKRRRGYHAARYFGKKYVYLHQLVLEAPPGCEIHHVNGDGLDNRRSNLEIISRGRHRQADLHKRRDNTSGYRGVWYHKQCARWAAEIMQHGQKFSLGLFDTVEEAAKVRDAKAREFGWPESGMNFPQ